MVGDDEVNSSSPGALCRGKGTSAGIYANHQSNACGCGAFDHVTAQVVAFADAMRDVKIRCAAAKFNRSFENYDGGGAVNVVIAVNEDSLLALDCGVEPIHGRFHSSHQIWRMQLGERWRKKLRRGLCGFNSAEK